MEKDKIKNPVDLLAINMLEEDRNNTSTKEIDEFGVADLTVQDSSGQVFACENLN
jgi:hypothetical protein